jgi:hypothetical protein
MKKVSKYERKEGKVNKYNKAGQSCLFYGLFNDAASNSDYNSVELYRE